jgi:hypothetical protein
MYHKHDQISLHTNPLNQDEPPEYQQPKFFQLRIYYQCESEYFKNKKLTKS